MQGYAVEEVSKEIDVKPGFRRPLKRWYQIAELEVGQGIRVPESELSYRALDPTGTMRSIAWVYGKKMGRKFRTQRQLNGSILIYRVE